jgi:hypothetical protein
LESQRKVKVEMQHEFSYPQVSEIRSAASQSPKPTPQRASQRALVEASLLRVPLRGQPRAANAKQ